MKTAPHLFTLRQLQYVVAVDDALSFSRAARACHVSQPSLSAQLAQVERALGVTLFERSRRRVLVTAAGRELVERARRLLREADDLAEVARRSQDPLGGELKVGVIPTVAPYALPEVVPSLRRAFPKLTLLWREDRTAALVERLESGGLDAALVARESALGEVEQVELAVDPFVLVTRPADPLGHGGPIARVALRDAPVLVLDEGHCFGDQVLTFCSRVRANDLEFRATSLATLAQMVAGGAGVTLLPQLAVRAEVPRGRLTVRRFEAPAPSRTLVLAWRPRSPLAPALREVARVMREAWPTRTR